MPAPQKRIAVLGGTVSGTTAARRLAAAGHRCDLFRNLFDPARSIHNAHPLCEYQKATFLLRDSDSEAFKEEVQGWLRAGLVEDAADFRFGRAGPDGRVEAVAAEGRRLRPKGGFMNLCDALCKDFARRGGTVLPQQLAKMAWSDSRGQEGWWLEDIHGSFTGPYDLVLLSFDQLPRASRKAAFKQMLESALPATEKVMACAGRALQASSMAAIVSFDPPLEVPWDTLVVDGVPEVQMAARNPPREQLHRGLNCKGDTWTLVSTTAWSFQTRPTHTTNWDKGRVGRDIVKAFGKVVKQDTSRHRMVVPTFHWQGASGITRVGDDFPPCIFDTDASLGWCGDVFGGLGPAGAVASGAALVAEVEEWMAGRPAGALPGEGAWVPREARPDDDDIMSISGPSTARREPQDGCDHSWPAAAKLAAGLKVAAGFDSLARYRGRNVLAQDQRRDLQKGGGGGAPAKVVLTPGPAAEKFAPPPRQAASPKLSLRCEAIDDGLYKLSRVPREVQRELLAAVFPVGARGVCGGLYDQRTGRIDVGGSDWQLDGPTEASWSEMGLHGNHVVDWGAVEGGLLDELVAAVRAASKGQARGALDDFAPDTVRVAFETMHGRRIGRGQTLCGWSKDGDHVEGRGADAKLLLMLGSSKVTIGFKYSKADRESLEVDMQPGELLIVSGAARSWVSAVAGAEPSAGDGGAPFDFAHVWLCDHRQLKRAKPDVHRSIHGVKSPQKGDFSYKWMQYEYQVSGTAASGDRRVVLGGAGMDVAVAAAPAAAGASEGLAPAKRKEASDCRSQEQELPRRRWKSTAEHRSVYVAA